MLEQLAESVRPVKLVAGAWLLREGERGESAFVVRSGRLEVVSEDPPETVIAVLRRGDVFGELALLVDRPRAASVRAQRDSEVLEVPRRDFELLVQQAPNFALGLTRTMGAQLAAARPPAFRPARPRTVAVVALDEGAPAEETAELLTGALQPLGSADRLPATGLDDHESMRAALDRAEAQEDHVILCATQGPLDRWTAFCVREADLVVAITRGAPRQEWTARPAALRGCELLVAAPTVPDALVRAFAPREVHALAGGGELRHAVEVLARRVAGKAIGVVLSGGGARAFAHLGIMEVFAEAGLTIDRIGGVSLGAIVGAVWATGEAPEEIYARFERNFVQVNPANDFTWPAYSLIRGAKTRRLLHAGFGDVQIEALRTRFFCTTSDLLARESVIHRRGPVWEAVYASMALPGIYPPVRTPDGRLLVDGGVLDNLPVAEMARSGEGPVIAVDVTGRLRQAGRPSRRRVTRLVQPVRRFLTGSDEQIPRLGETVMRTVTAGSRDSVAAAREHADVVIAPVVDHIGLMEFRRLADVRETGRRAAHAALAEMPAELLA